MDKEYERVKFTTTIRQDTLKDLDLIKIDLGLDARNDVIEFLTANYRGKEYVQYKNKKRKPKCC